MQAASPALEITRLPTMVGAGTRLMQGVGLVVLAVAALSVFVALWNAVRERRADLAMLRMLGAAPGKVGALLLCEALWLALLGCLIGLALAHGATALLAQWLAAEQSLALDAWRWVPLEWAVPALALGVSLLAAAVPVASAYRVDVTQVLQSR